MDLWGWTEGEYWTKFTKCLLGARFPSFPYCLGPSCFSNCFVWVPDITKDSYPLSFAENVFPTLLFAFSIGITPLKCVSLFLWELFPVASKLRELSTQAGTLAQPLGLSAPGLLATGSRYDSWCSFSSSPELVTCPGPQEGVLSHFTLTCSS